MGDTITVIIVILASVVILVVFPLMSTADKADDLTQVIIEEAVNDWSTKVQNTGKATPEDYQKFIETIMSTGRKYDVDIVVYALDTNLNKKGTIAQGDKEGENLYYELHDVLDKIDPDTGTPQVYQLKEGYGWELKVLNPSEGWFDQLKSSVLGALGNDNSEVVVQKYVTVNVNG